MDILIINSLIVLNSLNSVMINYELFRRNFDSERLSYTITELLLLRQLVLRRASYMVTDIVETIQLLWSCRCRRAAIILSLPCSSFELIPLIIITTQRTLGFRSLRITHDVL